MLFYDSIMTSWMINNYFSLHQTWCIWLHLYYRLLLTPEWTLFGLSCFLFRSCNWLFDVIGVPFLFESICNWNSHFLLINGFFWFSAFSGAHFYYTVGRWLFNAAGHYWIVYGPMMYILYNIIELLFILYPFDFKFINLILQRL